MHRTYLMENADEIVRLEVKTEVNDLKEQASWAGIRPGMRVADIGCGSGITTAILHGLVQPGGQVVGVDGSSSRIEHAREEYKIEGIEYVCRNIMNNLDDLGKFDFVWVRFLLEYYRTDSIEIVRNISTILKPGGILCLIDLDYNCLSHYPLSVELEKSIYSIMKYLEEKANFDPYVGRKLYSFIYDLGFKDIDVNVTSHHLIFGELRDSDAYNWLRKIEVLSEKIAYEFEDKSWGYEKFRDEFRQFFSDPRRFTYTPLISCRGVKPA